jgi:hypothetical protein
MIESQILNQPDDWEETSAPWPFTEEDILDEDEDIELPDESSEE